MFYQHYCNTYYDRLVIHTLNHYAHTLRLVPKSTDLSEGHPQSRKEYRNRELVRRARSFSPQLILLTRGLPLKHETLEELRRIGTVFCWYLESEKRFPEIEREIPFYHHTYFFSSKNLELAQSLGNESVSLLQHTVDTSLFYPTSDRKKYDWSFVGSWTERRQEYLEKLTEVVRKFAVYGPGWPKLRNKRLRFHIKGEGIWCGKLTQLYNQSRVVINVSVWGDEGRRRGRTYSPLLMECVLFRTYHQIKLAQKV